MEYRNLILNLEEGIGHIVLNRPESLNALNEDLCQELIDALRRVGSDQSINVAVISGAGRGFCSGGDIKNMGGNTTPEEMVKYVEGNGSQIIREIRGLPQSSIAAVHGHAVGAGCNIAIACDMVYAAENARFGQAFIKLALHPDCGGTYLLPRLVGVQKACEMVFTGDSIGAQEALRVGLVTAVFPDGDLMARVWQLAQRIAAGPGNAVRIAKKSLYAAMEKDLEWCLQNEAQMQRICSAAEDHKEAVSAFWERRPPRFSGR